MKNRHGTLLLGILLFLGVFCILAILSGGIMRLFGFTYDHVGSIILLMLGGAILSYPCEILTQVICKLLVKSKSLPINGVLILYVILDTQGTMIGLGIVDLMMDSVKTNQLSLLVIGLVFALLGYKDMRQELTM